MIASCFGGSGEIRTHGAIADPPVFKTGALSHSATLPNWCPLSDSNRPPPGYKAGALPDELSGQNDDRVLSSAFDVI